MKSLKVIYIFLAVSLLGFTSCEDTGEVGEYDNWQERNIAFIDSIATVARADSDGKWEIFPAMGLDEDKEHGNEYNVYCHVMEPGSGVKHPVYTDSVQVNYRGRLIPSKNYPEGYVFDSSYDGELEPEFDVPVGFSLQSVVVGFSTAVQHMVVGDIWRVYIPANLGYGAETSSSVPAYSTLIFDINLVSFLSAGTN